MSSAATKNIGYFYVINSKSLREKGCLEIGTTFDLESQLSTYRHEDDDAYYLFHTYIYLCKADKIIQEIKKKFAVDDGQRVKCSIEEILDFIPYANESTKVSCRIRELQHKYPQKESVKPQPVEVSEKILTHVINPIDNFVVIERGETPKKCCNCCCPDKNNGYIY